MLAVSLLFAVIGVLVLTAAVVSRVRIGRLPRSLVVEYAPRRGSTVIGDAVLLERDRRAAAAALLDLAVRRRVRLIADTSGGRRATVAVEVLDEASLTVRDLALLEALFGPGHPSHRVRRFSRDGRAVGRRLRALVEVDIAELRSTGLVAGDGEGRRMLRLLGWLGVIATSGATVGALLDGDPPVILCSAFALATAIATLAVTPSGRARRFTPAAAPWRSHLDGLRQYLTVAEADRMRALQSPSGAELGGRPDLPDDLRADLGSTAARFRLHERLLPYAVLFGIEREWLAHLKLAYEQLDETSLRALGDALDATADLFVLADTLGDLVGLGLAVGDLVDAGGAAVDVVGGVFEFIGDLTP